MDAVRSRLLACKSVKHLGIGLRTQTDDAHRRATFHHPSDELPVVPRMLGVRRVREQDDVTLALRRVLERVPGGLEAFVHEDASAQARDTTHLIHDP